jgi:ribonuclease HII
VGCMTLPSLFHETEFSGRVVCGIDEAGRGPWAGPVVAAAVVLDQTNIPDGLNDSKKLTHQKRETLFEEIMLACRVGTGIISVQMIDRVNILQATYLAMKDAVASLGPVPDIALVDGNRVPPLTCTVRTIVGGDAASLSIAAASIVAKVTRDRIMCDYESTFPGYGFAQHKGYGTAAHHAALRRLGPCDIHRMSFAPIKSISSSTR